MSNRILDVYKEQIKYYEKLTFEEAKDLLRNSMDKSDEEKKLIIEKVFNGTLHYVLTFIETSKYGLLNSRNYDLNDVVNISYTLWYKKIADYSILEIPLVASALGVTFSHRIFEELISSSNELDYYTMYINRIIFNLFIEVYFDLRNRNVNVSYSDFVSAYCEKYDDLFFERYNVEYVMRYILEILEKCYLSFSKNDTEEVVLNRQCIKKVTKLIEEMGLFETLSVNFVDKSNFEDEIFKNMMLKEVKELLFESDILDERKKRILILYFGLFGNKHHNFEEIGKEFDISRERVRQLWAKGLRKLIGASLKEPVKGLGVYL